MNATSPTAMDLSSGATEMPLSPAASNEDIFPVRRFSVDEYERIGRAGILTEDDSVELLEGLIVEKTTKNPRHDSMIDLLAQMLTRLLPPGWFPRAQNVLLTADSAPEPDLVVTHGDPHDYWNHHPTAGDVALVIEVAESSLLRDRRKRRIYARAGIAQYWIVNLVDNQIELFREPDAASSEYLRREAVDLRSAVSFSLPQGDVVTLPLDTSLRAPS